MELSASSNTSGGIVEVWLDSLDTGRKIAECQVDTTGSTTKYQIFRTDVDTVSGSHDVYLKFLGTGTSELFRIKWFRFLSVYDTPTSIDDELGEQLGPKKFELNQNYPNPFNPTTRIRFSLPGKSDVGIDIFSITGQLIKTLTNKSYERGIYETGWDGKDSNGKDAASGMYIYKMLAGNFIQAKKMLLVR